MKTASKLSENAIHWLEEFARCVRDRTYDEARPLFEDGVYSFGTVADQARGLDNLVQSQWREVWDVTEGFDFEYQAAHCWESDGLLGVATPWSSKGVSEDGESFERHGRATLLLRRIDGKWKAVHSHFSMNPDA